MYLYICSLVFRTPFFQPAFPAFGLPCSTDVSPVQYKPVVRCRPESFRDVLSQVFFYGFHCLSVRQSQPARYSEHMCVYCDHRFVIYDGCDDIGSLASDPGKLYQFVRFLRDPASEVADQHLCHSDEVAGLVVRKRYRFDEAVHFLERS